MPNRAHGWHEYVASLARFDSRIALLVVVAFVLGAAAVELAPSGSTVAPWWPAAAGVALVALLVSAANGRRRAHERLSAGEELFRLGFDEARFGMLLVRVEGGDARVVEHNLAAGRLLGLEPGRPVPGNLRTAADETLTDVAAALPPDEAGWQGTMKLFAAGRQATTGQVHGGAVRWFDVAVSRLTSASTPGVFVVQLVEITKRVAVEEQLEHLALHDHLTGLPNRAVLEEQLETELSVARRFDIPVALVFVDVDDFKLVNDSAGHRAGDQILIEVGRRISASMRVHDTVARIGGDEFVLVCPGATSPAVALSLAERIWRATEEPIDVGGLPYEVNLSIGVALSTPECTADDLLSQADIALYASKASGKRRITLYSDEHRQDAERRVRIGAELRDALANDELRIHMQPVIELETGQVVAAEALVRWEHPIRGLSLPGDWLDVAERSGLMPELGGWVLDESCRQAAAWVESVGEEPAPAVHVNVSARQLDAPGFADLVIAALERHDLAPQQLILELTETHLAQVGEALVVELEALSRRGVRIAADDYGTGYSPLTRLTDLPIDMIKVDRQFVEGLTTDRRSFAIVVALVELAATLDIELVAEGVESLEHAELLTEVGCRLAQGFLWSRAVPASDFAGLLSPGRFGVGV